MTPMEPHFKCRAWRAAVCLISLLSGAATSAAFAQTSVKSPLDGLTPPSMAPGSPAGSYALSGFETVNLFSGSLNFRLPLVKVGGSRGEAGYTMMLPIQQIWQIQETTACEAGSCDVQAWGAVSDSWKPNPDSYGPGRLNYRYAQIPFPASACPGKIAQVAQQSLTKITFTAPDGTEYELRDDLTNGETKALIDPGTGDSCSTENTLPQTSRGTTFSAHDGSLLRFVSDSAVYDTAAVGVITNSTNPPTGNLLFPNGSLYRIVCGRVSYIRDRNGNLTNFRYEDTWTYDSDTQTCSVTGVTPSTSGRVTQIVDSLGHQTIITYRESLGVIGDEVITFRGAGGKPRSVTIHFDFLASALRTDYAAAGVKARDELFLGTSGVGIFNPMVATSVTLPNDQKYLFQYNAYGELARVVLPTGGAYEYDWGSGYPSSVPDSSGAGAALFGPDGSGLNVYRRVLTRRVYADGGTSPVLTETYVAVSTSGAGNTASPGEGGFSYRATTTVTVDHYQGSNTTVTPLATETHHFYGDPGAGPAFPNDPSIYNNYTPWMVGREFQTDSPGLRSEYRTWAQGGLTTWWSPAPCPALPATYNCVDTMPAEFPRITQIDTKLLDASSPVFSRRTLIYDQYNNVTDTTDYDYAPAPAIGPPTDATPGAPLRRTQTTYLWPSASQYVSASGTVFLPSLPVTETVSLGNTTYSTTSYEYDNYQPDQPDPRHAALQARASIVQMDPAYTSGTFTTRGNVTGITRGIGADSTTVSGLYDVAGNLVKTVDGKGNNTTYDYDSNRNTYAYLTKITNPLNHMTSVTWDLDLGKPLTITDPNSNRTKAEYADVLDRLTKVTRPDNSTTGYSYTDTPNAAQVTTSVDLWANNDQALQTTTSYDGLGRAFRVQNPDGNCVVTSFDGLGRVSDVSNPGSCSSPSQLTTTTYDGLDRVLTVTAPDSSVTETRYAGPVTLVLDASAQHKTRQSTTDALGRLTRIVENQKTWGKPNRRRRCRALADHQLRLRCPG